MKQVAFNFEDSRVTKAQEEKLEKKLSGEIKALKQALKKGYEDDRASINLCDDLGIIKKSQVVVNKVRSATTIVVIGIGGSNLGTMAIYETLKGKYYNELEKKKVYFADTVDSHKIQDIAKLIEKELKQKRKVVLNIISKSGGTTEPIANFQILLQTLKKYHKKDYNKYVVATTQENSKLFEVAKKEEFHILDMPHKVGGRYSVLSAVGVFPLQFLGVDMKKVFKGAKEMRDICLEKSYKKNPAMRSASFLYTHAKKGRNIANTFLFSPQLENVGKWYRQLMGESIGKEWNKNHTKKVHCGITPSTSIGSTDLHSITQLYLGGPDDKSYVFVHVNSVPKVKLGNEKDYDAIVPHLQKRPLEEIMNAILRGVQEAFRKKKKPFYEISLGSLKDYEIGSLLQMKMIEMMMLGVLLDVNPFDQPNVEEYKIITKKLLSE